MQLMPKCFAFLRGYSRNIRAIPSLTFRISGFTTHSLTPGRHIIGGYSRGHIITPLPPYTNARYFSSKKEDESGGSTAVETEGESTNESSSEEPIEQTNDDLSDVGQEESLKQEVDFTSIGRILRAENGVILEIDAVGSDEHRKGRQAQGGKVRRKPIPIATEKEAEAKGDESKIDESKTTDDATETTEVDETTDDTPVSDDPKAEPNELSIEDTPKFIQFKLPVLQFPNSTRVNRLPALALYRKPAFPGFYQVLQIRDPLVFSCLQQLKQNSGYGYVGGFLTKSSAMNELTFNSLPILMEDAGSVGSYEEMHLYGTLLQIITVTPDSGQQGGQIILMAHKRIKMTGIYAEPSKSYPLYRVSVAYIEDQIQEDSHVTKALQLEITSTIRELTKFSSFYKEHMEQNIRFYNFNSAAKLADIIAGISMASRDKLQLILAEQSIDKRLSMVLEIAKHDLETIRVQREVRSQIEEKLSKDQRRYILMEQMKFIKKELGVEVDDKNQIVQLLETQFEEVKEFMSAAVVDEVRINLTKLRQLDISSAEFNVCRTYLEFVIKLPWGKSTDLYTNIHKAKRTLDAEHYGLLDVKNRLLEYIATCIISKKSNGKIICLIGPPGVGKTSIAISMAKAINRKYYHLSLGGVTDVAELRGHRRTYVGAYPGKFVYALKYTNVMNPLIILDEIDKLGINNKGTDVYSVLLEALDPSQNHNFRDLYLDLPIDLSKVLFICTANTPDTIPLPLLDRMEIINIPSYLPEEKLQISKNYLIPKIQEESGLNRYSIQISDDAIEDIIKYYNREAGVRNLQRSLERIHRKIALAIVQGASKDEGTNEGERSEHKLAETTMMASECGTALVTNEVDKIVCSEEKKPTLTGGVGESAMLSNEHGNHATPTEIMHLQASTAQDNTSFHHTPTQPTQEHSPESATIDKTSPTATDPHFETQNVEIVVGRDDLTKYLGVPVYTKEAIHEYPLPYGLVMGLAWTNFGGATMYVEAHGQLLDKCGKMVEPDRSSDPTDEKDCISNIEKGSLKVTGHLGTIMNESSQIALTYCKSYIRKHQPRNIFLDEANIHIHIPEGATPKDGPSGGITMATALISLAGRLRLKPLLAMTGELTLSGKVLRVGGIKEKLIAAIREGIKTVILPKGNKSDVSEIEESITSRLEIIYVDTFDEVYDNAFE